MGSEVERRLAAIVAADMVGYSRLMEADEVGTLARLKTHRLELIDPAIAKNRGRIIKTAGDGMLIEFQSVADAMQCAIEIQRRMVSRNADVPAARWIQFRIGINLGDVIVEDGDVFGDGVNVAARLQELAEPGGICVSRAVRDQVQVGDRLRRRLPGSRRADRQEHRAADRGLPRRARPGRSGCDPHRPDQRGAAPGSDRPSIAVLPFANMSGEPEQEFFADGLTEDIITALSRFRELFVISRNSAFVYKGKAVTIQDFARRGRRAVRGRGQRAQGRQPGPRHGAADRRPLRPARLGRALRPRPRGHFRDPGRGDLGDRRDAVRPDRGGALRSRGAQAHRQHGGLRMRADRQGAAPPLDARGQRAGAAHARPGDRARPELRPCPRLEGLRARPGLGVWLVRGCRGDASPRSARSCRSRWVSTTATATCTASSPPGTWSSAGTTRPCTTRSGRSASIPNNDLIVVQQGELLTWLGRPEEGIDWIRRAMQLNPYHPERYWNHLGRAYYMARRYPEAAGRSPDQRARPCAPRLHGRRLRTDGRCDRGRRPCRAGDERVPGFSVDAY